MLENILGIIFSIPFAFSILRITTPILFAALAAVVGRPRGPSPTSASTGIMMISALTGVICGGIGTLFHYAVEAVTALRQEQNWLIFLLPFLGLAIVFLYRLCRMDNDRGTDGIIESVSRPARPLPCWRL